MILALLLAQAAAAAPLPDPGKALHETIVKAIRNCPEAKGDEIAVCSKDRGYAERYRLQKLQKPLAPPSNFQIDLASPDVAAAGIGSCSATGAGGVTGCSAKEYDAWAAWRRQQKADGRDFPW
ncbi:hypothetical protein FHS31_000926 [Sphingomonas vulcanisoli]|uniref:Secreted protein n=1 Tax=Sphingomonas vulcanisoli TaxID=1658060 RepID=A0ABX0TU83_9SPHN|nr:hypothetical protein [Sphingomonas vulcanisoli]NIJ07330.1 hypothetical protein [Sphingomonas vulcanisoli]